MRLSQLIRSPLPFCSGLLLALAACGGEEPETPPSRPHNVLLFAVDTLRADRVGAISGVDLTPRIDEFARGGRVFSAAYAQATQTHPAMASVMTGLVPPHHGAIVQAQRHSKSVVTLAELLADNGLRTGSFVANLCQLQDFGRTVWSDGWDEQFCGQDTATEQYVWDQAVVDEALDWIGDGEEPFFTWVHLMDPHAEYRPPVDQWDYEAHPVRESHVQFRFYGQFLAEYAMPPDEIVEELEALYDAQVRGVDRLFGRMLDTLEERGLLEDTLVVFVADHGEELFETWPKAGHGFSLTEGVLRVPLVVAGPGVEPGQVGQIVETLQVTPTVLDLMEIEAPYLLDGGSLLSEDGGRGWAASFVGDRASIRRGHQRWWGQSSQLVEAPAVVEYLKNYPTHTMTPWYQADEVFASYPEGSYLPEWQDLSDPQLERAVRVAFRQPLTQFLREGVSSEVIVDENLERALERLGYR